MEIIEAKTATIQMIGANILLCTMKKNAEVDAEAVTENHEIAKHLTGGERHVSLVDARKHAILTDEAKKTATNPELYANVIAQAVVITSLTTRLLVNFIMSFTKQNSKMEMKMFNDYDEALIWLKVKLMEEQVSRGMEKYKGKLKGR
ncbi:MAG TPA: hypothetical protein VN698_13170 [Bacteroidia bacterium]|nr:hypothetical protein [Bacteroidia bacterium]